MRKMIERDVILYDHSTKTLIDCDEFGDVTIWYVFDKNECVHLWHKRFGDDS